MRALLTDNDVRLYGHVAHRKQRHCRDPRSSSLYRSLYLGFSWARAMGHVAYPSCDQSAQAFPVFKFTALFPPPGSKTCMHICNGEGLGPRLRLEVVYCCFTRTPLFTSFFKCWFKQSYALHLLVSEMYCLRVVIVVLQELHCLLQCLP